MVWLIEQAFHFFASARRACSGSIVHAEGRANRAGEAGHVLVDTSAAPWPLGRRRALVWLHCMLGHRSTCAPSPTWLLAPIIVSSPAGRAQWEGSSATAGAEGCWPGKK